MGTINRACDVDGCDAAATTRYLDASGAVPVHFVICDIHAESVLDGTGTIVQDGGTAPVRVVP